jgi:integrase
MAGTVRKRIRRNRQGEVHTTWLADYTDQSSKRHNRTFATQRAARDWLLTACGEVRDGLHTPDADSITVAEAAEIWLAQCERDELEHGTVRVYEQYVRLYIDKLLGAKKLSRLTTPVITAFRDALFDQTSRERTRKVISALRLILTEMQRRGLVGQNAALPVKVKLGDRGQRPLASGVDVPSKAEIAVLQQHAAGRMRARFITLALTGIRASELRALEWSHIDFDRRILSVQQRADWWGKIGLVKTKNAYRDIPLTRYVVNALREWRLACPGRLPGKRDLVFPGRNGAPVAHSNVEADFDAAQRAAGIVDQTGAPKYPLHSLRHFFASWGIDQGFNPKRLQELMGHGSIKMTFDVYGHWLGDIADDHARLDDAETKLFGAV